MLRVPSSTESSRFLYSRLSQTFTALPWRPLSWPIRTPSGIVAVGAEGRGAAGADPLIAALVALLLLGSRRCFSVSISLSKPPMASIAAFSSSVRNFSVSFFNHSAGMSAVRLSSTFSKPLNTWPNTRSNLSRLRSSFTRAAAGQVVEVVGGQAGDVLVHRLHQHEVLFERDRHAGVAEFGEQAQEHGGGLRLNGVQLKVGREGAGGKRVGGA